MTINFNDLSKITFDGTVYNEVTKSSDNTSAITQEASNVTYDNFLLHSSKEWMSTLENISTEIIKEAKDTSDKVKADNKVIDATKKAAPDSAKFKDSEAKLAEGIKDLVSSAKAMADITNYTGALNFITTTAVNTITGSIVNVSDFGTINKSPSITNTSNVVVNNAATSINRSDTIFSQTDRSITLTNQQLLSASDQHGVVTNETSITSTKNTAAAVETHQVITAEQKQYNTNLTSLSAESILIGSKGAAKLIAQSDLIIGSGQTVKTGASQAVVDDVSGLDGATPADLPSGSNPVSGEGSITILSSGNVKTQATGIISNVGDTFGAGANKIGFSSIDFASNSTTTNIISKAESNLVSEGVTYTGTRNVGISINPFGILAGSGLAPLVPFLAELLPPIVIDIPELPEFPFGSLADFLSKCLPFTSVVDIPNVNSTTGAPTEQVNVSLEDPLVPQDKGGLLDITDDISNPISDLNSGGTGVIQTRGNIDQPVNISTLTTTTTDAKSTPPVAPKGVKSEVKERAIDKTPTVSTTKKEDKPFTAKQATSIGAKLGVLHKVYAQTPEEQNKAKTTTTVTTDAVAGISPKLSFGDSLQSLASLQKSEVVNSFNVGLRTEIANNYDDFLKSVAIVDTFGPQATPLPDYSKTVNDFLLNKALGKEVLTVLNILRPKGTGGQQPPNIQDDINSNMSSSIGNTRTPSLRGQGILDILTTLQPSVQPPSLFNSTQDNYFTPEQIGDIREFKFGDDLLENTQLGSISELLNNKYVNIAKGFIPDSKIQSVLSLTQEIAAGTITTPEQYANKLAALVGGDVAGYIGYANQAIDIYKSVQAGNYTSLLGIPRVSNVLGSQGTAIASKVLGLIGKSNITDKDIYSIVGSIFSGLTGIGIPLLDELAKLLGCVDSLKQDQPFLQDISNPDLQDIIDYLPRIIQTTKGNNANKVDVTVLNITPSNCGQVIELSAEEATINVSEIGPSYVKFKLSSKELIRFNNNPLPTTGTPVNLYVEYYTDRVTNRVLRPYKFTSQFTSNVLEYTIVEKLNNEYKAILNNNSIQLVLEDNISGALFQYTSVDIGNRLAPYVLDSYILL